ncbi:diguanylate cyclase [Acetobacterium wieringae]|uniref:Diguanylate cyclase n=1 Tax=Acetobacterium wieringae TaxID=52694 RepID=A0ABY6HAR2_9FIRM|nr:HD domain-containing phosphohydrolase [Acetobacterium wieringae]UYO61570.1 diguanylate cyclase [Acetobacterium wieringae]
MTNDFYHGIIKNLHVGYAYHRIICDTQGTPVDYEFIEVNRAFEAATGLIGAEIIGKTVTAVIPEIRDSGFDWIRFYGEIALNHTTAEIEQYSSPLNRWYRVQVYSPETNYFITLFNDITREKRDLAERNLLLTTLHDIVFEISTDYHFTNVIVQDETTLFAPKKNIIGSHITSIFSKDLSEEIIVVFKAAHDTGQKQEFEYKSPVPTDKRWFLAEIFYINDNESPRFVVSIHDISRRKRMEKSLFIEKERLQTTLLSIGDGVISTDSRGCVTLLNKVAENLTGWNQQEAYGLPLDQVLKLVNEYTRESCENPARRVLEEGLIIELNNHTLLLSKDGREIPIEDSAAPIKDQDGQITGVVIVFRDFTDKKEKQEKIEYLSFHDHLTGLYNRRYFDEELKRLNTPRNLPLSLLIFDVNGLKLTNDAFGHMAGDRLLKKVAQTMQTISRSDDIIARIGGDEFVILLPQTEIQEAKELAKRINTALSHEHLEAGQISISSGWAVKTTADEEITEVFKAAENKMYQYKISERNSTRNEAIQFIMKTLYEKLPREQQHSERVSNISGLIGAAMGMNKEEINELKTAGALHDIGKIAIGNEILDKTGELNDFEWLEIRRHPEISFSILSSLNDYAPLANIILVHHERYDGTGYPKGLSAEQIPLPARIIAIADAFDAMTYGRPYKEPLTTEAAIREIVAGKSTQFDPAIADIFLSVLAENNYCL